MHLVIVKYDGAIVALASRTTGMKAMQLKREFEEAMAEIPATDFSAEVQRVEEVLTGKDLMKLVRESVNI